MQKILLSISLLYCCSLNAQFEQLKVLYTINYNTDRPLKKKGTLYLTADTNVFIYGKDGDKNKVEESKDDPTKLNVFFKSSEQYVAQKNDSLISKVSIRGDAFILKEKISDFNWKIQDSTKMIGNYNCRLATGHFRGRDYKAWFTEAIPVSAGPWKFDGLSGLIIDIADTTGRYHWIATRVFVNLPEKIKLPECKKCDTINIKDFEKLRYDYSGFKSSILSKLPRGATSTFTPAKRNGIELTF